MNHSNLNMSIHLYPTSMFSLFRHLCRLRRRLWSCFRGFKIQWYRCTGTFFLLCRSLLRYLRSSGFKEASKFSVAEATPESEVIGRWAVTLIIFSSGCSRRLLLRHTCVPQRICEMFDMTFHVFPLNEWCAMNIWSLIRGLQRNRCWVLTFEWLKSWQVPKKKHASLLFCAEPGCRWLQWSIEGPSVHMSEEVLGFGNRAERKARWVRLAVQEAEWSCVLHLCFAFVVQVALVIDNISLIFFQQHELWGW